MNKFILLLPSKNFIKYLLYLIIIIISIIVIKKNFNDANNIKINFQKETYNKEIAKLRELDIKDTDGDGLKDWQELLYKTDPELTDTDGDGISDFDEIQKNRDPVVFGVGKKESIENIISTSDDIAYFEDQKKDLDEYKKKIKKDLLLKLERRQKDISNISNNTLDTDSLSILNFDKEVKDLNKIADSIVIYNSNELIKDIMKLDKLFTAMSDNGGGVDITELDIIYYKKIADLNKKVYKDFNSYNLDNTILDQIKNTIADGYKKVGESLDSLIDFYETGAVENRLKEIKKYGEGQKDILMSRQKLHLFIENYNIKFKEYDSGSILRYSM